jgi:hypothetical protein
MLVVLGAYRFWFPAGQNVKFLILASLLLGLGAKAPVVFGYGVDDE